jgi:hypothetical protein
MLLWHRIVHKKGWIAPSWPRNLAAPAGVSRSATFWEQESAAADTLPPLAFGLTMVGPVIYSFGTAGQRERFPPGIL